jgi:hypothetical protein
MLWAVARSTKRSVTCDLWPSGTMRIGERAFCSLSLACLMNASRSHSHPRKSDVHPFSDNSTLWLKLALCVMCSGLPLTLRRETLRGL